MPSKKKMLKNPAEKVLVKSKGYGVHERAPRGSKSVLNRAMKAGKKKRFLLCYMSRELGS
jgi:hypothetical protein